MGGEHTGEPVAVVGMACRVAGADNWWRWWERLLAGDRAIRPVPPGRFGGLSAAAPDVGRPYAALVDDVDRFDARFFGMSRRMAAWTDPQQRMLLELSWHALECAGIVPESLRGAPVAVFAATWVSEYRERMAWEGRVDGMSAIGTLPTFLANRLSYQYGLTGPSLSVDTACSASMTAFALAVRGIQHGDFPMALVGAVNVLCGSFVSATGYRTGLLSRTGESVPFGQNADGYIRGEGGACVVLKRLDDALREGDPVLGVVRSVSMNHDGGGGGLTAPDPGSHTKLISDALARSGVAPSDLGYLEAHGPGTATGDPVEIRGVRDAIGGNGPMAGPDGKLWVGSAKGNVGHLESAAGLVGVVKALLTLRNERIIGIPGLTATNPDLPLEDGLVAIADRDVPWPRGALPRLASVSSFGLGGSNAHTVLEEGLPAEPDAGEHELLFPLSARTDEQLRAVVSELRDALGSDRTLTLPAVAWTLQTGRTHQQVRLLLRANSLPDLLSGLDEHLAGSADAASWSVREHLWLTGEDGDWAASWPAGPPPRRTALPGHPFDREVHWFSKIPLCKETSS